MIDRNPTPGGRPGHLDRHGGRLCGLYLAGDRGARLRSQPRARALAGAGLAGDRYQRGVGTFSGRAGVAAGARQLSIIDARALAICNARLDTTFDWADLRRNLVVEGLDLRRLVGHELIIGAVVLEIVSSCPPCGYLSRLLGADLKRGLAHWGGVRAAVRRGGTLRLSSPVSPGPG